jgi:hypothetical protein
MSKQQQQKFVKIAGVVIRDQGVIAALDATAYLESCNRHAALRMAAELVERDMFGLKVLPIRAVKAISLEALRKEVVPPVAKKGVNGRRGISLERAHLPRKVRCTLAAVGY